MKSIRLRGRSWGLLLCRSFLQSYGYENIPLLYKLEQLCLFHVKRQCDIPISVNANTTAASRGEALIRMGRQVAQAAQNLTETVQPQKNILSISKEKT